MGDRTAENRTRLECDTTAYFEGLSAEAAAEESRLETALDQSLDEIDFDPWEPGSRAN